MRISVIRTFLGGFWVGNAVPHILNGITRRPYPCAAGNGPVGNTLGGSAALMLAPLVFPRGRRLGVRRSLVIAGLGAIVSLFLHARFVDVERAAQEDRQRVFGKHRQATAA